MFTLRKLAVVLSTALAANAQLSGLSSTCTGSAGSLLLGPLGSCLSLTSLIPIFSESGSIIAPLDSYLGQICSSSACSSDTISSANQTIQQNCQSDIQSGSGIAPALATILDAYPTVREVACLQAAGNGTRCITQTLYAVQNATGQDITIDYLTSLLGSNATSELSALGNLDASVLCTDCTRAMYLVAEQNSQSTFTSGAVGKAISSKCGSSFASTSSFPADVSNTIGSATASASGSSTSAAASSTGAAMKNIQAASVLSGSWALIAGVVGMGVVAGGMGVLA